MTDYPSQYQLAEVNIARLRAPLTDPILVDFVNNLPVINALAEGAPGFVWRLKTPAGDATDLRVFDDDMIIVNLTVWESIEALQEFTYRSDHVGIFRRRTEWFEKMDTPSMVMWWVAAGHEPTAEEAKAKIDWLAHHGPSPLAFTFKQRFSPEALREHTKAGQQESAG